jgi:hypothetical protein
MESANRNLRISLLALRIGVAIVMLAACLALFLLRREDTLLSANVGNPRG